MSQSTAELVQRVKEITGTTCSTAEAKHLLAACDNDVEAAITLFYEGGGSGFSANNDNNAEDKIDAFASDVNTLDQALSTANVPFIHTADDVRAPIAPIREQLIGPEDDNFYSSTVSTALVNTTTATERLSNRMRRVKVCPLRDFAREGALMEEQLQQAASGFGQLDNNYERATHSRSRIAHTSMTSVEPKRKRLEDLYRPPTDIAFPGTLQAARTKAELLKKWLLVNVQTDNFDSQLLNRDVWPDKTLRKLIKNYFLLWQIDVDSSEGRRFVAFYHCTKLPYLCVIDPRTGEEMWKNIEPRHSNTLPELQKFILEHKNFNQEVVTATASSSNNSMNNIFHMQCDDEKGLNNFNKRTNRNHNNDIDDDILTSNNKEKSNKILELTEEEQIALAIRNSMRENNINRVNKLSLSDATSSQDNMELNDYNDDDDDYLACSMNNSDFDNVEQQKEQKQKNIYCDNKKNSTVSYEQQLGSAKDELTMLKLRMLKDDGTDDIVQLQWPSDTHLKVLHNYINQKYPHIMKRGYKLICAFPRKVLLPESDLSSLKEIGLHPSANLHITFDD